MKVPHKIQRLFGRENNVQVFRELFEQAHERKAQILVIKHIKESIMICQIIKFMLLQQRQQRVVAGFQLKQFLLRKAQHTNNFFLFAFVVVVQRLFQVMANAYIVHHKAFVLGLASNAVNPGNGLQQAVRNNHFVQVHHLLYRSIKTGQQHVVHNNNADIAIHAFIVSSERQFEAFNG